MVHASLTCPRLQRTRKGQQGAFAVAFALMTAFLLFFVGLGVDVGRLYVSRTELQSAADACALASASALTGSSNNQLDVAEAWGIRAGTLNLVGMQAAAPTMAPNSQVTFATAINGAYATKAAIPAGNVLGMTHAKCLLQESNVGSFIVKAANAITAGVIAPISIRASAIATLAPSSSACAVPLAMCATTSTSPYGFNVGDWKQGKFDPGSSLTGAYKWVNFPGYTSVPDMKAMLEGNGSCTVSGATTVSSQNGSIASLLDPWNNHFGLYKGSSLDSLPDYTGFSYTLSSWPSGTNAFADFINKRAANAGPPNIGNGWKDNGWATAAKGDRRLVVAPIIDCSGLASNASTPVLDWACMLMLNPASNVNDDLYLEFRGLGSSGATPCAVAGAPGGPGSAGPKVPALVQ